MSYVSDSTSAVLAGQRFMRQFMELDAEGFRDSLDSNVKLTHSRQKGSFLTETVEKVGAGAVFQLYKEKFFDVTNRLDCREASYHANGLNVVIKCEVEEDKMETGSITRRYAFKSEILLEFQRNNGTDLKITRIWDATAKLENEGKYHKISLENSKTKEESPTMESWGFVNTLKNK